MQQIIFLVYLTLFVLPMLISTFKISPEVDSLMFYIATLPVLMLIIIEAIQFKYQGLRYFYGSGSEWNIIDCLQILVFGILLTMRIKNYDGKSLIYPELKLVNIVLAFFKTQFFVRIYDKFSLLV